eukprot:SM000173S03006  [mRNA]  locus=s173:165905:168120:+ [translate_table: standard]
MADKNGKGLRHFSMKVCEKVESKGRTTYNEVADELVAEFTGPDSEILSPDQQYDEKNIRRRVYDALNVLMAMDIIAKEKKEIHWKGLPSTTSSDTEQLKAEHLRTRHRLEKKAVQLEELQEQIMGIKGLVQRNEETCQREGAVPVGLVPLPFLLVQTRPVAIVEVEISEDMQLVHFDFNSTPFELRDDYYVLRAMGLCCAEPEAVGPGRPEVGAAAAMPTLTLPSHSGGLPAARPLWHSPSSAPRRLMGAHSPIPTPAILKARVKQESYNT